MAWQNGLYQLATAGLGPSYTGMLRVDLHPDNFTPSYVSLDLYRGFLESSGDPDLAERQGTLQYLGSFRSKPLGAQAAIPPAAPVSLKGLLDTTGALRLTLLPPAAPSDPSLTVLCDGSGAAPPVPNGVLKFEAAWQGASLRVLTVDVDASPGMPSPETATAALSDGTVVSFADCYKAAGVLAFVNGPGDGRLPQQANWTLDQLLSLAAGKVTKGWSMHAYLMIVSNLNGSGSTTGAMFDKDRRSAAAVFYNSLFGAFHRTDDGDAELMANYLFTAVHEVGHCLNLPHSFENWRPNLSSSSATFMNYPQNYTGSFDSGNMGKFRGLSSGQWSGAQQTSYRNFWSIFQFDFCPDELLELRHGALRDEETGGADPQTGKGVSPYRGLFANAQTCLTLGGSSGAGLELELRVRRELPPGAVRGAPVGARPRTGSDGRHFRVRRADSRRGAAAKLREGPPRREAEAQRRHGRLADSLPAPDGRCQVHQPPVALCYIAEEKPIDGDDKSDDPDSFFKDVCLSFGLGSFGFLTPGKYRVRASYRYHDTLLVSNVLELYVRHPTPQVENIVVPLLDQDVASYFAFRGVHGLPEAKARLETAFEGGAPGAAEHPLYNYYCAHQARLRHNGSVAVDSKSGAVSAATWRVGDDALHWFPRALGFTDLKDLQDPGKANLRGLPFSNIRLGKIGKAFHKTLVDAKELDLAAALAGKLNAALKKRRVPAPIRARYLPAPPADAEGAAGGRRRRTRRRGPTPGEGPANA